MAKRTRETGNTQSRNAILPAPKTTIPIQQFTNRNAANAKASSSKPIKAGSSTSPPAPPPPAFSLSYGDGDYDAALPLFPDPNLGFHIIPAGKTERQEAKINNAFDAAAFLSHAFVRGMVGKWQSFSLEANGRSVALSVEDGEGTTIRFCTVRLPTPTQSTARGFDVVKETKDYTTKAEQHARLVLIREILNPSSDILEIKTPDFCDDDEEDDDQQAINTEAAESLLTEPQRQFQHFVQTTPRTNPLKTLRTNFSTTSAQLFVKSCAELIAMLEKGGSTLDPDPEGKFVSFGSWEPLANEMKLCCTAIQKFVLSRDACLDIAIETLNRLRELALALGADAALIATIETQLALVEAKNKSVEEDCAKTGKPKPKYVPPPVIAAVVKKLPLPVVASKSPPRVQEEEEEDDPLGELFGDGSDQGAEDELMDDGGQGAIGGAGEDEEEELPLAKRPRSDASPAARPRISSAFHRPPIKPITIRPSRDDVEEMNEWEFDDEPLPPPIKPHVRPPRRPRTPPPEPAHFDNQIKNELFGGRVAMSDSRRYGQGMAYCTWSWMSDREKAKVKEFSFHCGTIGETLLTNERRRDYFFEIDFSPENTALLFSQISEKTNLSNEELPLRARVVFSAAGVVQNMDEVNVLMSVDFNIGGPNGAVGPRSHSTDITSHLKSGTNKFTLIIGGSNFPTHPITISIELFRLISLAQITARLSEPAIIDAGSAQDVAAQERIKDLLKRGEKVEDLSLIDVFSRSRLETPVRGKNCTHLSAFDLHSYLIANRRDGLWNCPIPGCGNEATPDSLLPSEWLARNLAEHKHSLIALDVPVEEEEESVEVEGGAKMNGIH